MQKQCQELGVGTQNGVIASCKKSLCKMLWHSAFFSLSSLRKALKINNSEHSCCFYLLCKACDFFHNPMLLCVKNTPVADTKISFAVKARNVPILQMNFLLSFLNPHTTLFTGNRKCHTHLEAHMGISDWWDDKQKWKTPEVATNLAWPCMCLQNWFFSHQFNLFSAYIILYHHTQA